MCDFFVSIEEHSVRRCFTIYTGPPADNWDIVGLKKNIHNIA